MRLLSSNRVRLCLLFFLGLALFSGFSWKHSPQTTSTALLAPLPQDPLIQVYLNQSQSASFAEPYRHQERAGDDFEQMVVGAIASAQSSVDVAVHELRLPHIAQALHDRQQAGVRVRVILENTYSRPWSAFTATEVAGLDERGRGKYQEFLALVDQDQDGQVSTAESGELDAVQILQNAQIPWLDDTADGSRGSGLMHHKFIIVDNRLVITGSANFTPSDFFGDLLTPESRGNANNLVRIDSSSLAQLFTQEFNSLWGDGPGGKPDSKFGVQKPYRPAQQVVVGSSTVTVQFSPYSATIPWQQTTNGLIGRALTAATHTINMALFVFSEQNLSNLLDTEHQQGVQVRALIDRGFAYRNYSEGLDMLGIALPDKRCRYEENNHPWRSAIASIGVPNLPPGDLLHHKFGVVDGQFVIFGSHNWSNTANENNDENLLVIQNPVVAAHFEREFERLYDDATLGLTPNLQQKIQRQQQQCQ